MAKLESKAAFEKRIGQPNKETLDAYHRCQDLSQRAAIDHDMAPVLGVAAMLSFLGWVAYWILHYTTGLPSVWGWIVLVIIIFVAGTAADMEQRGNRKWRQAEEIEASAKEKLRSSVK